MCESWPSIYAGCRPTARRDFRPIDDFELGRDTDALFAASPDDILLLEVTYWLNP